MRISGQHCVFELFRSRRVIAAERQLLRYPRPIPLRRSWRASCRDRLAEDSGTSRTECGLRGGFDGNR
jgi:uncharacterized protein (DUF58 family)